MKKLVIALVCLAFGITLKILDPSIEEISRLKGFDHR